MLAALLLLLACTAAQHDVYVDNVDDTISLRSADGTETQLASPSPRLRSVAIDGSAGKMYWSEADIIRRADASDGSSAETVVFGSWLIVIQGHNLGSSVEDIASATISGVSCSDLQLSNGATTLTCRNADGSAVGATASAVGVTTVSEGVGQVVSSTRALELLEVGVRAPLIVSLTVTAVSSSPAALAIDADAGFLFWSDFASGVVRRSALQVGGTGVRVIASDLPRVSALAVGSGGWLYATEETSGRVVRMAYDGSSLTTLHDGLSAPAGIVVDDASGFLYFSDLPASIYRASLDGGRLEANPALPAQPAQLVYRGDSRDRIVSLALPSVEQLLWAEQTQHAVTSSDNHFLQQSTVVQATTVLPLLWPTAIVVHDGKLYSSHLLGSIYSTPLAGGSSTRLVQLQGSTSSTELELVDALKDNLRRGDLLFVRLVDN